MALMAAQVAAAQATTDTLDLKEVTVTAIKQGNADLWQKGAVTVLTRRDAERNHVEGMKSAAAQMPNVHVPDYGSRMTSTIYVRGIGSRIDQPSMGLTIDNVPILCKENYDFDVPDVARIEMLRGPQSTLYGRNTMAGVMNVYTLSPLNYQGTRIVATAASHGRWQASASHYARLNERLAMAGALQHGRTEGQWRNAYNGKRTDWERATQGRLRLEWLPAPEWQVSNVFTLGNSRQGGYPYEQVGTGEIAYNDTCFYKRTSNLDGLTVSRTLGEMSMHSITSYQYVDDNMTLDQDFTPRPYFTLTQARKEHALTQEFVARGRVGEYYRWTGGLFGFYRNMRMNAPVTFKDVGIAELIENHVNEAMTAYPVTWDERTFVLGSHFRMPVWGVAAYHESHLTHGPWTLTVGARLDYEHASLRYRSFAQTGFSVMEAATGQVYAHVPIEIDDRGRLNKDFLQLLPRLTATYRVPRHDHVLRWVVSKGSKAGGFNTQMFSDVLQQRLMGMMGIGAAYDVNRIVGYKPEKAWNFEVGGHFAWLGQRVVADVAAFVMDCRDRQLTVFPDGTTTGRVMTNAGHTRNMGAEASLAAQPWAGGHVRCAYGYTDARFVKYNDGKSDYKDKLVPYTPQHTLVVEAGHELEVPGGDALRSIELNVTLNGVGSIEWNESNTLRQPFYALMGGLVSFKGKHYALDLWAQNLTDTRYHTFYFVSIGHEFTQRGSGRSLGATMRWHF